MRYSLIFIVTLLFTMQAKASTIELIESVKQNNLPRVIELLTNGEDVNATTEQGNTALHFAVATDNADITQVLLSYGADLNKANIKGWTPLNIAEKKQVPNVTPLLLKAKNEQEQKAVKIKEDTEIAQPSVQQTSQNIIRRVKKSQLVKQSAEAENNDVVKNNDTSFANQPIENPQVAENNENINAEVAQALIEAKNAQITAENKVKLLTEEIVKLKAENSDLNKKLTQESQKAKPADIAVQNNNQNSDKKEQAIVNKPAAVAVAKTVKQRKIIKAAPKKPTIFTSSKTIEGVYVGDEEIVYCLNHLGHGENSNLLRAAAYFAASANITENRYKQITELSNNYINKASAGMVNIRNQECNEIIMPKNTDKLNQVIRSLNKASGY